MKVGGGEEGEGWESEGMKGGEVTNETSVG